MANDEYGPLERLNRNTEITFAASQGDAPGSISSGGYSAVPIASAVPTVSATSPQDGCHNVDKQMTGLPNDLNPSNQQPCLRQPHHRRINIPEFSYRPEPGSYGIAPIASTVPTVSATSQQGGYPNVDKQMVDLPDEKSRTPCVLLVSFGARSRKTFSRPSSVPI